MTATIEPPVLDDVLLVEPADEPPAPRPASPSDLDDDLELAELLDLPGVLRDPDEVGDHYGDDLRGGFGVVSRGPYPGPGQVEVTGQHRALDVPAVAFLAVDDVRLPGLLAHGARITAIGTAVDESRLPASSLSPRVRRVADIERAWRASRGRIDDDEPSLPDLTRK